MPIKDRKVINATLRPDLSMGTSNSLSTMVPPSPFLARLMASQAYSTVTRMTSVQTISDNTPKMWASIGFVKRNTTVRV